MVRLQITGFFRTACTSAGRVILPNLSALTNDLRFGTWRPPLLPPVITRILFPPVPASYAKPRPSQASEPLGQRGPSVPPHNSLHSGQPNQQPRQPLQPAARDRNHAFHQAWLFRPELGPVIANARLVQGGDVPLGDDNVPFCLTFQFKGDLRVNCKGRSTHRPPTTAEFTRLDAWHRRFCVPVPTTPPIPPFAPQPAPTSYTQTTLPRSQAHQQPWMPSRGGRSGPQRQHQHHLLFTSLFPTLALMTGRLLSARHHSNESLACTVSAEAMRAQKHLRFPIKPWMGFGHLHLKLRQAI